MSDCQLSHMQSLSVSLWVSSLLAQISQCYIYNFLWSIFTMLLIYILWKKCSWIIMQNLLKTDCSFQELDVSNWVLNVLLWQFDFYTKYGILSYSSFSRLWSPQCHQPWFVILYPVPTSEQTLNSLWNEGRKRGREREKKDLIFMYTLDF